MTRMRIKAMASIALFLFLLVISVSGAMLYFGKTGLILGVSRALLLNIHARCSLLFAALVILHLALNFSLLKEELKKLFKAK